MRYVRAIYKNRSHRLSSLAVLPMLLGTAVAMLCAAACRRTPASEHRPAAASRSSPSAAVLPRRSEIDAGDLAPRIATSVAADAITRLYRISVHAGDLLHVIAEQQGADVALELRDPDGRSLLRVDNPNGELGRESLDWIAPATGELELAVATLSAARGGRSRLTLAPFRRPSPADRERALACQAASDGDAAAGRGDAGGRAEALRQYDRALAARRTAGDREGEAWIEARLGGLASDMGDARQALLHREHALGLLQQVGREDDAVALENDLGLSYRSLGDVDRARRALLSARTTAHRLGDRREEISAVSNLGLVAEDASEPWEAFLAFDEAAEGWRDLGDRAGEAATLQRLGRLYAVLGKLVEARGVLDRAVALYGAAGDRRGAASATVEAGWVRFLAGDAGAARAELGRALALAEAAADRREEAVARDRLGSLDRELGDFAGAVREYRQALDILQAEGDRRSTARTLSNLGEALTRGGDAPGGLAAEDDALRLLAGLEEPSTMAYAHFRRALAERRLNRLDAARGDMETGLGLLEGIRARTESPDLQRSYVDSVHDEYERLVDLLMDLDHARPGAGFDGRALAAAERSRARGLLDLVAAARRRGEADEGSAGDRLRRIAARIRAVETERRTGEHLADPIAGNAADERGLEELVAERERILTELRHRQAAAAPLSRAQNPLDERGIRALLDPETVLLFYSLGERRSFLWAVTAGNVAAVCLPSRAVLEAAARRYHGLVATSDRRGSTTEERLTAAALSQALLGPVATALAGRRIAVVPDGALAYVPFGALPDPVSPRNRLLARHEVLELPSASVLAAVRTRAASRPPPPGRLAVLAAPLFELPGQRRRPSVSPGALALTLRDGKDAEAASRSARDLGLTGLAPLPFAREEARRILALVPPFLRLSAIGAEATSALATGGALRHYDIVHFATHALIHPRTPELSGILLSLVDARGRPLPGFLRSYEIADLDLPADLVVLSACRTGLGRELRGEGLVGLTQSFFEAGATRVVVSLWNVDDRATAELMGRFYRELLVARRPPAAALREAQLALARDPRWSAPYFWAGFALQGDWRPIRLTQADPGTRP